MQRAAATSAPESGGASPRAPARSAARLLAQGGTLYTVYVIFLCVIFVFVLYTLLHYSFDGEMRARDDKLAAQLADPKNPLERLINAAGIDNIPNLNIVTTNANIQQVNQCGNGPVFLGKRVATDDDCIRLCAQSNAKVLNVPLPPPPTEPSEPPAAGEQPATTPDAKPSPTLVPQQYIFNNSVLEPGAHCILGQRPECNLRMTTVMMTANSIVCRPRYPRLVGGPLGNRVIACNDRNINDPKNVLWDYRENVAFDPWLTEMMSGGSSRQAENEKLADTGEYRFRCRYNGVDEMGNRYIANPIDRFHPIRNYCAALVYKAHPNVRTVFKRTPEQEESNATTYARPMGFVCACGNFEVTRVANIDSDKTKTSQCANVTRVEKVVVRNKRTLSVPHRCFTLYSPITDVGRYFPCPNDQFTREGSQMTSQLLTFSTNLQALIEHPSYESFDEQDWGVKVMPGLRIDE